MRATLLLFFFSYSFLIGQVVPGQSLVVGFGYRLPGSSITAAPGQITMVSVNGIATRFDKPVSGLPDRMTGNPLPVNGLSAEFAQGSVTVQVQIQDIQQTACPATGACSPATSITLQIPYELQVESRDKAVLRIRENAAIAAEVTITPVTDNVHIINSCDQTAIFLSIAVGVPANTCAPVVMHARGPLVSTTSPAVPGETLLLWAYGLGALNHPFPTYLVSVADVPVAVQPYTLTYSYFDSVRLALKGLVTSVPPYVGMPGGGLYQVHIVVPDAPAALGDCRTGLGNLRILLSGPSSADAADICMAARAN